MMVFSHLLNLKDRISIFKLINFVFVMELHKLRVSLVDSASYHLWVMGHGFDPSWLP